MFKSHEQRLSNNGAVSEKTIPYINELAKDGRIRTRGSEH